jgi:hypothetical protein
MPPAVFHDQSVDNGHGRIETRRIWVIDDPQVLKLLPNAERWPQLSSVIKIESQRTITAGPLENEASVPPMTVTTSPAPPPPPLPPFSTPLSANTG